MDYVYNTYSAYGEDRSYQLPPLFPGGAPGGQPVPGIPGGPGSYPPYIPGGGGGTGGQPPYFPGGVPGTTPGVPAQLSQSNLPTLLSAYPRPVGQPPSEMVFLYNLIKSSPGLLPLFIQQQPQNLTQAVQFAQTGVATPRDPEQRVLQNFCYNRWSLVFTYNDVYLMWPSTNLFGFVIGYFYPFLTPGILLNTQILFALC
ncbi:hypothetical protein QP794_11735 [Paenibacillus sp. UMB7766-LJ446]|uniref:hypothetical protein n=1 Tax=Paenibacillus sp. UMB7766-LJ446 TaxID=3046313 RepID=UPI00254B5BC0|nr:hypothetical protein [Paenibacillus sp. UMB7766-LJ446]MDK8190756.1 hypothetical protein [Paenibacillus sp. UMB7766-LJ446]